MTLTVGCFSQKKGTFVHRQIAMEDLFLRSLDLIKFDIKYQICDVDKTIRVSSFDFEQLMPEDECYNKEKFFEVSYKDGKIKKVSCYSEDESLNENYELFYFHDTVYSYFIAYRFSDNRHKDPSLVEGFFIYDRDNQINYFLTISCKYFFFCSDIMQLEKNGNLSWVDEISMLDRNLYPLSKSAWFKNDFMYLLNYKIEGNNYIEQISVFSKKHSEIVTDLDKIDFNTLWLILTNRYPRIAYLIKDFKIDGILKIDRYSWYYY